MLEHCYIACVFLSVCASFCVVSFSFSVSEIFLSQSHLQHALLVCVVTMLSATSVGAQLSAAAAKDTRAMPRCCVRRSLIILVNLLPVAPTPSAPSAARTMPCVRVSLPSPETQTQSEDANLSACHMMTVQTTPPASTASVLIRARGPAA